MAMMMPVVILAPPLEWVPCGYPGDSRENELVKGTSMSGPAPHPRFAAALADGGLDVEIRAFPESTRTAAEAASAIGCDVGQIVKSLVFDAGGTPTMVLVDGASRVDEQRLARELGVDAVRRAHPDTVRAATGYAIGGVPPFGHATPVPVLVDPGLLEHDMVWAAAGTPNTVFPIAPRALIEAAGATVVEGLARGPSPRTDD
jgi:prolyl-tRNA editing enzyme YbaK/EbsC (Cys-tRNA(Pro) deacylase)